MEKSIDFYDAAMKIAKFLNLSKATDVLLLDLR